MAHPRRPARPPPEQQSLRLVVYFDNLFLRPTNRNKVVREVSRFVHRVVGPNDQVMLATFEKSLHIRHPFTSDLDSFLDKLTEIEKVTGYGDQANTARRDVIQRVERSASALRSDSTPVSMCRVRYRTP